MQRTGLRWGQCPPYGMTYCMTAHKICLNPQRLVRIIHHSPYTLSEYEQLERKLLFHPSLSDTSSLSLSLTSITQPHVACQVPLGASSFFFSQFCFFFSLILSNPIHSFFIFQYFSPILLYFFSFCVTP